MSDLPHAKMALMAKVYELRGRLRRWVVSNEAYRERVEVLIQEMLTEVRELGGFHCVDCGDDITAALRWDQENSVDWVLCDECARGRGLDERT